MREILFRGKIPGIIDWVYGYYAKSGDDHFILLDTDSEDNWSIVAPETVGQYTGLKDKNGKKIFEGDIIGDWGEDENGEECFCSMGVVNYWEREGKYVLTDKNGYCNDWTLEDEGKPENWEKLIIIGNIHDNPELLQEGKQ